MDLITNYFFKNSISEEIQNIMASMCRKKLVNDNK
jgi:hypothetical protein